MVGGLHTLGASAELINAMLHLVIAILHLGQVSFDMPGDDSEMSAVQEEASKECLAHAAKLLGISYADIEMSLCYKSLVVKEKGLTDEIRRPNNVGKARETLEALARQVYAWLFRSVVKLTSDALAPQRGLVTTGGLICGLLDLSGFEVFESNSLEQLCINAANEQLQAFFTKCVFEAEQKLYNQEEIRWDPTDFPNNDKSVELLMDKEMGLFSMLTEECRFTQGTDELYVQRIAKQHAKGALLTIPKTHGPLAFCIKHFAGDVEYSAEGFVAKNRNLIPDDITKVLGEAKNIALQFSPAVADGARAPQARRRGSL